jgi:hypothetical protein
MLNIKMVSDEEKAHKYADRPPIEECVQHFIVKWATDSKQHFQIFTTFNEAMNIYERLNEILGEPCCSLTNVTIEEVYLY